MGLNFGNALEVGRLFASMGIDTADYNRGLDDAEHRAHSFGQRLAGSFQRVAETATGVLIGQALPRVIGGLQSMATEALNSVANYERLGIALGNLAKRDILAAGMTEKMVSAGQVRIQLTGEEREKLEDLGRQRDILAIKMKEEELRHQELVKRYGEEGLATQRHALEMAGMRDKYDELNGAISRLEGKSGTLVEQFKKVTNQTITDAQAKELAAKASEDLLGWIEMLAVKSPFDLEGVQSAFRMANTYGFVASAAADLAVKTGQMTQAQRASAVTAERMTQAMIDFASGSGTSPEIMDRIALAFGQINKSGKLLGQEVRQLAEAGISVDSILAKAFGKSTAEIIAMREKGLIPADKAIQAIVESMEKDFGGAAAAQAESLTGLITGLNDVKKIKLREFFESTFTSIQPYLAKLLNWLMSPEIKESIAAMGQAIGNTMKRGLEFASTLFGLIGRVRGAGDDVRKSVSAMADLKGWLAQLGITPELITLVGKIGETFGKLKDTVLGMLSGLSKGAQGVSVLDLVNRAIEWLVDHWPAVEGALKGIGVVLVAGGVLAAVAGLAGALVSLLNPVTLLIALAAGIGAAWETNFLGIRDTVQPILDRLVEVFETVKARFGEVVSAFQTGGLSGGIANLLGLSPETMEAIENFFERVGQAISSFTSGFSAGLSGSAVDSSGLVTVMSTIRDLGVGVGQAFDTIRTRVGEVVAAFQAGGLAGALQNLGVPAEVLTKIGTAFDTIKTKAGEVVGAFQEGGLTGALMELGVPQETLSTLAATFERIGNFLAQLFAPTIERLKQGFADFTAGLPSLQPLLEPLMGAFQNLWNALQPVFQVLGAIAGVVGGALVGAFNLLLEIVAGVMGSLPELIGNAITIVTEIINGLADLIRGVVEVVQKLLAGDFAGAWEAAKETVSGLWEHIQNIFTTMIDTVVTLGANVIEAIGTWVQNIIARVKEFLGIASPSTVFAQLGTDLVNGLLGGIMSMAGTVLSNVISFFDTNIKRALDFATLLIDAGKSIVEGLWEGIKGMGKQFGDWIIGWLKTWVPQVVLDFLGIKSPSTMFIEIGKQIIQGLIEGIRSMGQAAADAMIGTLTNVINAVNGIVQVLGNINTSPTIVNLREKLAAIIASIQIIVLMFRDLAKSYGTAVGGDALRSAKAVLDPLNQIAQALSGVVNVVKALGDLPEEAGDMRSRLTLLRQVIVDVINTLGVIGEGIGGGARARLKSIALDVGLLMTTIGGIFEPLREAFDFMVYLESARIPNTGTKLRGVVSLLMDLAYSLSEVVSGVGDDVLARAATASAKLQTILAPWQQVIDVVEALASYTDRVIYDQANKLAGKMRRMALILVTWADTLEPGQLERAGQVAAQFQAVLAPWKEVIDVVGALADYVDRVIYDQAYKLVGKMRRMAFILVTWADTLPPETLRRAGEVAAQFQAVLAPWQKAIEVVRALSQHADRIIGPIANRLASQMLGMARNLQQWADQMTPAEMARAVEAAGNFVQILEPWQKALDVVRSLKAWRILPDIEDRFNRLLKFWREAIFTLARVATVVDRDGLAAVVRFAQAIGDVAEGLRAALELGLAVPTHWEVPQAWGAFEQWVMDVFQSFYDWVNRTATVAVAGGGTVTVPAFSDEGMGAMSAFATALSDLMDALQTALELSLALPATWEVPAAWDTFQQWVMDVFQDFYDWITGWGSPNPVPRFGEDDLDLMGVFASALNDLMSALQTALQVAAAVPATWAVPDAWATFQQWVMDVFEDFAAWILGWGSSNPVPIFNEEELDLIGAFAGALNDLMGALQAALEVALGLPATWTVPAAWDAFQQWVWDVFYDFASWLLNWGTTNPVPIFTQGELDLIGQFAGAMEALFNGLAAALAIVSSLPATWTVPEETWEAFMDWVQGTMEYFVVYVTTYLAQNPGTVSFQVVTEFGNAMQAVFGGLQAALDLFRDINTWAGPGSQFQTRLTVFLGLVEFTFNQVEEYVRTNFTTTALQLTSTFAGALSAVVSALSAALGLFSALAGTEPGVFTPGTATLEFERRMQALMMAIGLTIEAFQTYIATEPNQLWFPTAAAFFDAVDDMMRILQSALDLFADLENANLPDPQEIQDFVDAVLGLFVAFRQGLIDTGGNINTAAGDIQGTVAGMPAGILAYGDPFASAGSSTIGSLAGGMVAGSVFVQDSMAGIVQVVNELAQWLHDRWPIFEGEGAGIITGLATGLTDATALATIAAAGTTSLNRLWDAWNPEANQAGVWAGEQAGNGIVTGLQNRSGAIYNAAYALAQQIIAGLNAGLIIGSPSRATAQIGAWAGEGLIDGFSSQTDGMTSAVDDMIGALVDPMQSLGLALVTAFAGGMGGGLGAVDAVLNSLSSRVTDVDPIGRMATLLEPPIGLNALSHRLDISNERRVHLTVDFQNADYLPPSVLSAITNELVRAVRTNA